MEVIKDPIGHNFERDRLVDLFRKRQGHQQNYSFKVFPTQMNRSEGWVFGVVV